MNRLSNVILSAAATLIFSLSANAQVWRQDPNYRYGYGQNPNALIGRVMSDLDRAARSGYLDGHERHHFEEAARKLQEFQERWARGKFDNGKLDRAIENLQHLANADRVRGRDRQMLAQDADALRQFRATRGGYERGYNPNWR